MVTAEYAPVAKVGGLADMTASLCAALAARGHDVRVVLPLYGNVDRHAFDVRPVAKYQPFLVRVGQKIQVGNIFVRGSTSAAVKVYMVENEALSGEPGIYTDVTGEPHENALARMVFHARAALTVPTILGWKPQVIHCHDAQAALTAVYLNHWYGKVPGMAAVGSLLTIHNLAYQEIQPLQAVDLIGLPAAMGAFPGVLEFHGQLNLLKAGILEAGLVNTVSPTYAREVISDPQLGCGLGSVLLARGSTFNGVLNGADLVTWDPRKDVNLPARYSAEQLSGKHQCRAELLASLGLRDGTGPLIGMVGRLVEQKGLDLVVPALDWMMRKGFCLALLGSGEGRYQAHLAKVARKHPDRVAFVDQFDDALAHRIIAGSDMFLMPSLYEPCGLTQMYAMRYGSVPVVRHTGGLADTVRDASRTDGTGFVFHEYQAEALQAALERALSAWEDQKSWIALMRRGMARDFSWDESASAYTRLYDRLVSGEDVVT